MITALPDLLYGEPVSLQFWLDDYPPLTGLDLRLVLDPWAGGARSVLAAALSPGPQPGQADAVGTVSGPALAPGGYDAAVVTGPTDAPHALAELSLRVRSLPLGSLS